MNGLELRNEIMRYFKKTNTNRTKPTPLLHLARLEETWAETEKPYSIRH